MIIKTIDMLTQNPSLPLSALLPSSNIYKEYIRTQDPMPNNLSIYDIFALLLSGRYDAKPCNSAIITFNYDVILDNACVTSQIQPYYSLPNEKCSPLNLKILKLHGSANWMTCSNPVCMNGGKIVGVKHYGKFLSEYKDENCPKCGNKSLMPLLVPPSWDKTQFKDILGKIWKEAGKEIREAKRIFILGYSFPEADLYFRYLLYTTLSFNRNDPYIYIVDTHKGGAKVLNKLNELLNKTFYERFIIKTFSGEGTHGFINNVLRNNSLEYFTPT